MLQTVTALILALLLCASPALAAEAPSGWVKETETDERAAGVKRGAMVNYFTLRVPMCAFLGGILFGARQPKDLWIFSDAPFRYYTDGFDIALEGEGKIFGIRALIWRYKELPNRQPFRSFYIRLRGVNLGKNHPSYVLVNGRRVWDAKKHRLDHAGGQDALQFPFWVEEAEDFVIDFVVDREYTPEVKAFSFRYGHDQLRYLGEPGERVHMWGTKNVKELSPADKVEKFRFGLFGPGYDFWGYRDKPELAATTMTAEKLDWTHYKLPDYPVQDISIIPSSMGGVEKFNQFMSDYVGANLLPPGAKPERITSLGKRFKGFCLGKDVPKTKELLASHPNAKIYWFMETPSGMTNSSEPAKQREKEAMEKLKAATGKPESITVVQEPWPPALAAAFAYDKGADILQLKNEELPQHNIVVAMARGAGRSWGKPWSWGCFTIKTPFPSMDFREQFFHLWYFSGSSFVNSETEDMYTLPKIMDYTVPYVKALRFHGLHPALGKPVERIGVLWSKGDPWAAPFTIFGHKDTFLRYVSYDHRTKSLTCKHVLELEMKPGFWEKPTWLRHVADYYRAHLEEQRGYNMLDVFFPKYGDFLTAHFARMLTGTPYGPVDFLYPERIAPTALSEYRLLTCLGHFRLTRAVEEKLTEAVKGGAYLVLAVAHLKDARGKLAQPFGLKLTDKRSKIKGKALFAESLGARAPTNLEAEVYGIEDAEPVLTTAAGNVPIIAKKKLGQGEVYVVLTERMAECADGVRPLLAALGGQVSMADFAPADDQIEYVVNRKAGGALVTVFNHGAIPVGSDRVQEQRIKPPEPLVSVVRGPWSGTLTLHLSRLGLAADQEYDVHEVLGLAGETYENVLAGKQSLALKPLAPARTGESLTVKVTIGKRAEYVVAPKGQGDAVFFGR